MCVLDIYFFLFRNENSLDFDEYLRMKIREVSVTFVNKDDPDITFELRLEPVLTKPDVVQRVCDHLGQPRNVHAIKCLPPQPSITHNLFKLTYNLHLR